MTNRNVYLCTNRARVEHTMDLLVHGREHQEKKKLRDQVLLTGTDLTGVSHAYLCTQGNTPPGSVFFHSPDSSTQDTSGPDACTPSSHSGNRLRGVCRLFATELYIAQTGRQA